MPKRNCSHKHSDSVQFTTYAIKAASKREIQKTTEVTADLIDNKVAEKIKKVLRTIPQNRLETVTNETEITENAREKIKERYASPEKKRESY